MLEISTETEDEDSDKKKELMMEYDEDMARRMQEEGKFQTNRDSLENLWTLSLKIFPFCRVWRECVGRRGG